MSGVKGATGLAPEGRAWVTLGDAPMTWRKPPVVSKAPRNWCASRGLWPPSKKPCCVTPYPSDTARAGT